MCYCKYDYHKVHLLAKPFHMGFPTIMYLSRSKVGSLWDDTKKSKSLVSSIKSTLSISLNPKFDIETEFKKKDKIEIPKTIREDGWPPYQALDIAIQIEKQLRKENKVGTMKEFLDGNFEYPCYKLRGQLIFKKNCRRIGYSGNHNLWNNCYTFT